jgi:flagellar L-ring protein precursor FlgH
MKAVQLKKWMNGIFWMVLLLTLLAGCVTSWVPWSTPSGFGKEIKLPPSPPTNGTVKEEGSLWSSNRSSILYADVKARSVGDIVTISIVESTTASKDAATSTSRVSSLLASWSGIFDLITSFWKINGSSIGNAHQMDFSNNFEGSGETNRTSSMTAYITAQVVQVLPNGYLVIQGTRQIKLNNEDSYINVQGVIRPEDISSRNVILSTYISDAVIELKGKGVITDKQHPGWLARILDWAWPL